MTNTPFRIQGHHRYDLREWLRENFGFAEKPRSLYTPGDLEALARRAPEIVDACAKVAMIDRVAKSAYAPYYQNDWERIGQAYATRDYAGLGAAVAELLGAIDVE